MQLHQFLGNVQERAQIDSKEQALNAIRATFETLSERLKGGESLDLAGQLPAMLQGSFDVGHGERFDLEEFCHRVANREGVDDEQARQHVQAVLEVTSEAVSKGEIDDVIAQLPAEYHSLFGRTAQRRPM